MNEPRTKSKSIPRAIALMIVIAALTGAIYSVLVIVPSHLAGNTKDGAVDAANKGYDLAKRLAHDIDGVIHFRPKIISNGIIVAEASKDISEFSTVEKAFDYTYTFESTWLGSTKRIKLKGDFTAKAGYDLTQPFSIDVAPDGKTIKALMPPAKLNSVELGKVTVLEDQDGTWNKLSAQDRQTAQNALLNGGKKSLDLTNLLEEADAALNKQLEETLRRISPDKVKIVRDPIP